MTVACGPFKQTAGGCVPRTEVFWAQKPTDADPVLLFLQTTCVAGRAVRVLTTDKLGTVPAVGYTEADKTKYVVTRERGASCESPVSVSICNFPTPTPVANLKIEFSEQLMHSASTEQAVMRIREYNEDTGLWTLRYENLDGTPFVGALPSDLTVASAQVAVTQTALLGCASGSAYEQRTTSRFDAETGVLESTLTTWYDSTGTEFVVAPTGFVLGACQPTVYVDRPICGNTTAGEIWNMVERTSVNALGATTVAYLDPDTSPMLDVTVLFASIRHGGSCECCNDLVPVVPPVFTDLVISKNAAPSQAFVGDTVTYTIIVANNGPSDVNNAVVTDTLPLGFQAQSAAVNVYGATGVVGPEGAINQIGGTLVYTVGFLPVGGSVTITVSGSVLSGDLLNAASVATPSGVVDTDPASNAAEASVQLCEWLTFHELFIPASTLMGVYGSTAAPTQLSNLGFVDFATGALTSVGSVPGANLNALGLDKATNNAVFIDRITGNIYTAYSPAYAITNPSTLQPGPVSAASAILGALDSNQTWWVGNITGSTGLVATINVATVDPQTGVQTAVPSLTATLNSGSNGFDFDFAPNNDLYALVGLNIYLATQASGYAGWTLVGSLTGIVNTAGSVAYDQGILRGTSSTGQVWAFDLGTLTTAITANLPAGTLMADMSGAVDPLCKQFYLNTCNGKYYEQNRVVEYVPTGTPVAGNCVPV